MQIATKQAITDGNGCIADSLICINDIAGPTTSVVATSDVSCNGLGDGVVQFDVTGGTGTSTLLWFNSNGDTVQAGAGQLSLATLDGDCYTIQAIDAAGCVNATTACINEPSAMNSSIFNFNPVSCNLGCDGDATVNVNGGVNVIGYTYSWNDPSNQSTQQATGLCAGTYTVTVSDDNGCNTQSNVTITEPTAIQLAIVSQNDASCFGYAMDQLK